MILSVFKRSVLRRNVSLLVCFTNKSRNAPYYLLNSLVGENACGHGKQIFQNPELSNIGYSWVDDLYAATENTLLCRTPR